MPQLLSHKATIVRSDGSRENVVIEHELKPPGNREKVMTLYFMIGIVAVSLSVVVTIIQLRKMK